MTERQEELIASEQDAHDRARVLLAAMRDRTSAAADAADAANEVDAAIAEWTLRRRLDSYVDDPNGLFFGSIDDGHDGYFVGRRHIEDESSEPVVIDWRAPAATRFYRATMRDPLDLVLRRRHTIEDHAVVAVFEEDFDDDESGAGGGVPDPLLAELERSRTGEMRDIVATIQLEQDEVIRAPIDRTVIVQGGPGTGKTAVGLHRAAFLLYEHREQLDHDGVLVVGPNQRFLRYISQVLPSLGEHAVTQLTVDGVATTRRFPREGDSESAMEVKGHEVMASVLRRLTTHRIAPRELEVPLGHRMLRLDAHEIEELVGAVLAGGGPVNAAREGFQQRAATAALGARHRRHPDEAEMIDTLRGQLRRSQEWQKAVGRIWPSQSAADLLRSLYSSPRVRSLAVEGLLDAADGDALARPKAKKAADEPWTSADLVLLDELDFLLNGPAATSYGHVVVDEAQDLSAMAMRMIARRAKRASMTILGDLAQATRAGSQGSWDDALRYLGVEGGEQVELSLGYRLPAPILDYASQLLPEAAPQVKPSTSVRQDGSRPTIIDAADGDVIDAAVDAARRLAEVFTSVAVLAIPDVCSQVTRGLTDELSDVVSVIDAAVSKGLEFDAVIVVEPASIVEHWTHGLRVLYVAMTRAVQQLHIIHERPLPHALRGRDLTQV